MVSDVADATPFTSSVQEPRVADKPFDNRAADLVLRTSDGVHFYVYKAILSLASPVFEDMLCLSRPPPPMSIEYPTSTHRIIDVKEEAHILDSVLRYCYPIYRPPLTILQDVRDVLDAAHKYKMIAVTSVVKYALIKFIDGHALDVFAIACACELYDICTKAAQKFVQLPFLSLESKELGRISARQYHRLLDYHERYTADGSTVVSAETWSGGASVTSAPTPDIPSKLEAVYRQADAPCNSTTADIILRSSDGVEFHVHRVILSMASPFFNDMFTLPQSTSSSTSSISISNQHEPESIPRIDVSEDAHTLEYVLRCCYPVRPPRLTQLSDVRLVLQAGQKYDIEAAQAVAEAALQGCIERDILGALVIAISYKVNEVCALALPCFLQHRLLSLDSTELDLTSAHHYHQLLQYHRRCSGAACDLLSNGSIATMLAHARDSADHRYSCWRCQNNGGLPTPEKIEELSKLISQALRIRPHRSTVLPSAVLDYWPTLRCSCDRTWSRDKFSRALADGVGRAIENVEIPNSF